MKKKTAKNSTANKPVRKGILSNWRKKATKTSTAKKTLGKEILSNWGIYMFLLPAMIWYLVWCYFPMYGIVTAFKDYSIFKGIWGSEWVGLENFRTFFESPYAVRVIRNTFLINIYNMLTVFPLTIVLALLLNELKCKWFKSGVSTLLYLPHFISTVVVAGIVVTFLSPSSGIVNVIIDKLGGEKIYFLAKPEYFRTIYNIMGGWQGIGFGTIIYTSALCGIDETLYEAARIDGASKLKQIWHITLPGIAPTISIMLIMRVGSLLSVGSDAILLLYQPITYETADVISTYTYRVGIEGGNYSVGTAIGLLNGVIGALLVTTANKISRKVSNASIW